MKVAIPADMRDIPLARIRTTPSPLLSSRAVASWR
jgi:hypothetical protein